MKRIYHPVELWEEMRFNMWGDSKNKTHDLNRAVVFTGNHRLYGRYMRRVAAEWKYSCENALSDITRNRKAWIGHAAVALALQIPEDIVRQAWGGLTDHQRLKANEQASQAISSWEQLQRADNEAHPTMGEEGLFSGYSG